MNSVGTRAAPFGDLSPLLSPQSVTVIGASDREGNLGGSAVRFLQKFNFAGAVWPVNAGPATVAGLPCYASIEELPGVPDLAVIAVPAASVNGVVAQCIAAGVPAAVVWAGGFAEGDEAGRARQQELEALCRGKPIKLCGPNCIGVINAAIGLTASFGTLLAEVDHFAPGSISMVSQSGGTAMAVQAQAQQLGHGFRIVISCGNEAVLGIPDYIRALCQDDGTRVIAVYTEGLSDPPGLVEALAEARTHGKPVLILKGGATEASGRAAQAHTGRLAGADRSYDAVFREFAAVRVYSPDELLDVCLLFASLRPGQLPSGNRVLLSSFGGGNGVIATDLCLRDGLTVPQLSDVTRGRLKPLITSLASSLNPVDLTPASMTNPQYRANLPSVLRLLADAPDTDLFVFLASGLAGAAPAFIDMLGEARAASAKPIAMSWLLPPAGVTERLAERGMIAFDEHARVIRAVGHLARHAGDTRHRIRQRKELTTWFDWHAFVPRSDGQVIVSEDIVASILEAAGLPVARGRLARSPEDAVGIAEAVGFPVAVKGISEKITHRAAAGLVALNIDTPDAVRRADTLMRERAAALGVTLDGTWVQHMFAGSVELLMTAFRDREFGVMIGCGLGGGMTEVIDDVVLARAPLDSDGAYDIIGRLRTLARLPQYLTAQQRQQAAEFLARFSALVASAPWEAFTFEVNPVKLGTNSLAAVDGLLVIGA